MLDAILLAAAAFQEPEPDPVVEPAAVETVGTPQAATGAPEDSGLPTAAPVAAPVQEPPAPDPWRNPDLGLERFEIGILLDLFLAFTEKTDSEGAFNELRVRSARLHAAAAVDEATEARLALDWGDPGDGGEFQLLEAAVVADSLPIPGWPDGLRLQAGQYLADLGPWNGLLPGELPAPQLDGFRRMFLGGNLLARGLEAHHSSAFRSGSWRWSLGLASEVEGYDADANEFGIVPAPAITPKGRASVRSWAATGRLEGVWRIDSEQSWSAGASLLHVPEERKYTDVPGAGVVRDMERHTLGGVDFGWERRSGPDRSHLATLELWLDDDVYRVAAPGAPGALVGDRSLGEALTYVYQHDAWWSLGGCFSLFDLPTPGDPQRGSFHTVWAGYRISRNHRVALFLTHTNPGRSEQKWYTVGAEWTIEVGARRSGARRPFL